MKTHGSQALIVLAVGLSGISCTSSKVTASWADPDFAERPIKKVMVLGLAKNEVTQRLFEDTFVAQLRQQNVSAVPGYAELPFGDKPDRAAIEAAIERAGVQTVLISRVTGEEERTQYNPPTESTYPRYHRGMYGYYFDSYNDVSTPGYYTSYKVYKLTSNLYDGATGNLIWTAQTETIDPDNLKKEIDRLVQVLIADLRKNDVL